MSSYMDFIKEQLYTLTSIPSPSGFTRKATITFYLNYLPWVIPLNAPIREMYLSPWVVPVLHWCWQPMWIPWALWSAPLKITAVFVPQPSEDINGLLQTVKTVPIHTRDGRVYTGVVLNTEPSAHVADQKTEQLEENMEILLDENTASAKETLALGVQTRGYHCHGSPHNCNRKRIYQKPFPG